MRALHVINSPNISRVRKFKPATFFAGNLIKHPAFDEMRASGRGYRVVGDMQWTDFVMNNTFWIGVYPGMTHEMLQHMITSIKEFCYKHIAK